MKHIIFYFTYSGFTNALLLNILNSKKIKNIFPVNTTAPGRYGQSLIDILSLKSKEFNKGDIIYITDIIIDYSPQKYFPIFKFMSKIVKKGIKIIWISNEIPYKNIKERLNAICEVYIDPMKFSSTEIILNIYNSKTNINEYFTQIYKKENQNFLEIFYGLNYKLYSNYEMQKRIIKEISQQLIEHQFDKNFSLLKISIAESLISTGTNLSKKIKKKLLKNKTLVLSNTGKRILILDNRKKSYFEYNMDINHSREIMKAENSDITLTIYSEKIIAIYTKPELLKKLSTKMNNTDFYGSYYEAFFYVHSEGPFKSFLNIFKPGFSIEIKNTIEKIKNTI